MLPSDSIGLFIDSVPQATEDNKLYIRVCAYRKDDRLFLGELRIDIDKLFSPEVPKPKEY